MGRNFQLNELRTLWTPVLEARLALAGSTATILPMGMPAYGKTNATTFTGAGEIQPVFTWSEAPSAFDAPLDLTAPASFQGVVPFVDFNGTDERITSPDAAYWSRVEVASPFAPFTLIAWVNPDAVGAGIIIAKYGAAGAREWYWNLSLTNKHSVHMYDDSAAVGVYTPSTTVMVASQWAHLAVSYTGDGGADAADSIVTYTNGVADTGTPSNNANYVTMEDLAGVISVASNSAATPSAYFNGKIAGGPCGILFVQAVLTADQILRDYHLGRGLLGV